MDIRLLGELEVLDDSGRRVTITGAKLRALLAVLALRAGRAVSADQLVDALWGEEPPAAVRNGLQGLVSKLRRALGSTSLVSIRAGGYALELPPDAVDVHRFERLIADGRAAGAEGRIVPAVALLGEADELWRGDPLAEFDDLGIVTADAIRLVELRVTAMEERLDLELQLGAHHRVIGELESLVASHPLRERPRALLMIALYRAGRQADALRSFQDARRVLSEELGLDPGPELRQLEAAVLAQDSALDAPTAADPGTAAWTEHRSSVPESLTPLVGRDDELRELVQLFENHRLITLVGPGGVGKTRLALEVARARADFLMSGACVVELAAVSDPAGVKTAIATALGIRDPTRLSEMVGAHELLLLLDNCEHVIGAAAAIAEELLRSCPGLRLLATSREGLRVSGETIWPVPPLAIGDAVELFLARSIASGSLHALSEDLVGVVAEICARLDGLPLAIELAAVRTRAFPIRQIASRLNDRFRLLTGGSRTALPRQQTLRAVVDWSYALLFDDEQRVFDRLSVFPGGCDLAMAEAVCADRTTDASELEDVILALVDKSLVITVRTGDEVRFTQLQTLAQYGRERLAERDDSERTRNAMAAYFARLCAGSVNAYAGPDQRAWLARIGREGDNLRGALEWAVENDDAETAMMIAGGASWPHWLAGTVVEGKRWLDEAFGCRGDVSERTRALALTGRGLIHFQLGLLEGVDDDLRESLAISRRCGDTAAMLLTYSFYAEVAAARGDILEGRRRRAEVLVFYESLPDDPFVNAARSFSRAKIAVMDGDLAEAERCYRSAAAAFSKIDRPMMSAVCVGIVADFDERRGDYAAATEQLQMAIATNDSLGLRGSTGVLLSRLGWVQLQNGDAAHAELSFNRALDAGRRLRNNPVVFLALAGLAAVHRVRARRDAAAIAATEALELLLAGVRRGFTNRIDPGAELLVGAATCCAVLGVLAADRGDAEHAARLLGHAQQLRDDTAMPVPGFQRQDIDHALDALRVLLGPDAFEVAIEVGRRGRLGHEVDFRR